MHHTRARFAGAVQTARSAMLLLAACSGADDTMLAEEGAPEAGAAATTHSTIAPAAASGPGGAMQSEVPARVDAPPASEIEDGAEAGVTPTALDPGSAVPSPGSNAAADESNGDDPTGDDGDLPSGATSAPSEPEVSLGLLLGGVCFPLCVSPEHLDPSRPGIDPSGFAEEGDARCVVPTGLVGASGRASCTYEGTPTDLIPPALDPARLAERPPGVASSGFFVNEGQLFDAYGNPFEMRGVNVPSLWFDPPEPLEPGSPFRYQAYDALESIAQHGANTVRIVWQTQGGTPHLLREIIAQVVGLGMVPMVELHDLTGSRSPADLLRMAEYYASNDIRPILIDFEPYLLVNVANEWSGDLADYGPALTLLRQSGINHTVVIDGSGFGQDINSILQAGPGLLAADPQRNLLFSLHMYESFADPPTITSALTRAAALTLPLIVGEFGWVHGGRAIDYEFIMSEAERLGVGFLAWSWKGNSGGDEALDLAIDWNGEQLSDYGSVVMSRIAATSERASIFE